MWYFTWVLGLAAALALGVINVMWYEAHGDFVPDDVENEKHDSQTAALKP